MRFILFDRIEELRKGEGATLIKNVSQCEDYFIDHFPGYPVVPGSIILGSRFVQQHVGRLTLPFDQTIVQLRSSFVETLGTLGGIRFEDGEWTPEELDAADELIPKYAGDEWTKRT